MKYYNAAGLACALDLLDAAEGSGVILAGGTDIMVEFNRTPVDEGLCVIHIGGIDELAQITETDHDIRMGCLVTAAQVLDSPLLHRHAAALWEAAYASSGPQVRNRATIGGNIGTASPAGDMVAALNCLGASVTIRSKYGGKTGTVDEIICGAKQTVLKNNEIITEISVPKCAPFAGSAFEKMGRRKAMAISLAGAACFVKLDPSGRVIEDIRVVIGSAAPTTVRAADVETALRGMPVDDGIIREKSKLALLSVSPITDQRATRNYRSELIPVLVSRAIARAVSNANLPGGGP